jgi:hypothetical protein
MSPIFWRSQAVKNKLKTQTADTNPTFLNMGLNLLLLETRKRGFRERMGLL